jgi:hypothetical protein
MKHLTSLKNCAIVLFPAYCIGRYLLYYSGEIAMKIKKLNLDNMSKGVTVDLGDSADVTIISSNDKKYQDYVQMRLRPYKNAIKNKTLGDEALGKIFTDITNDALSDVVVLGWSGIQDENGVDIPYSKEKAHELFTDPAYAEFKDLVSGLAAENETFRAQVVESITGN